MIAVMLMTDEQLIEAMEAFCERHDMAPTRFGREAAREAQLIQSLKSGRSISLSRANRIVAFMNAYEASRAAAPEIGGGKFPATAGR